MEKVWNLIITVLIMCLSSSCHVLNCTIIISESSSYLCIEITTAFECQHDVAAGILMSEHKNTCQKMWQEWHRTLEDVHKDSVDWRACLSPGKLDCRCGRNLWKCQLFSYLRCIYSLKLWQMYRRTGIKMSRWNWVLVSLPQNLHIMAERWTLLSSTGCSKYFCAYKFFFFIQKSCLAKLNSI